jgi:hypothetical protein
MPPVAWRKVAVFDLQSNDAAENGAHAGRGLACDEGPRKWASSIESCLFISRSSTGVLSESVEDKGDLI